MIENKKDYKFYLECDRIANGRPGKDDIKLFLIGWFKRFVGIDTIWKFLILLRKYEYISNCPPRFLPKLRQMIVYYRFQRMAIKNGYMILRNTCGPGLSLPHRGTIVINGNAKIGANCRIHIDVNIGTSKGSNDKAPIIGDNVYIAPGVKIFGPIEIADGCILGANAVVNRSCHIKGATLVGCPARML